MTISSEIVTSHEVFKRALTNNSTSTSLAAPTPTTTEPETVDSDTPTSNSKVLSPTKNAIVMNFFGVGSDEEKFDVRVFGWSLTTDGTNTPLWVPSFLVQLTATLSSPVLGVAGAAVNNSEYFADILVASTSVTGSSSFYAHSPENNVIASCVLDTFGWDKIEVSLSVNPTGTDDATSANFTWRNI